MRNDIKNININLNFKFMFNFIKNKKFILLAFLSLFLFCSFSIFSFAKRKNIEGGMSLENLQYADLGKDNTQSNRMLKIYINGNPKWNIWKGKFDFELSHIGDEVNSSNYIQVSEFYFEKIKSLGDVKVAFGRKKLQWSFLDDEWNMGVWQPRFRFDYLRPVDQGLFGLFLNYDVAPNFKLDFFASSIFVPEQGPEVKESEGQLYSNSKWFSSPLSKINLVSGKSADINYSINKPEMRKIVFNESYAMRGVLGNPDNGFWLQGAYAYKPVNQLSFIYQDSIQLSSSKNPIGNIEITPFVTYHNIYSLDFGYTGHKIRSWVSFLSDNPINDSDIDLWTNKQSLDPIYAASVGIDFYFNFTNYRPTVFTFSYLNAHGGNNVDITNNGGYLSSTKSYLGSRLDLKEAICMKVKGPIYKWANTLVSISSKLLYEFWQRGTLFSTELQFQMAVDWSIHLGLDILDVDDSDLNREIGFIDKFRVNDRFFGGVSFVF